MAFEMAFERYFEIKRIKSWKILFCKWEKIFVNIKFLDFFRALSGYSSFIELK
jgi:hypothetical protein